MINSANEKYPLELVDRFVILISGVPGSGKTTVSYELLKRYNEFRLIQETDIIREILRGYNEYLDERFDSLEIQTLNIIPDHRKIFNYCELKEQCLIMRNSIENIILRQQRKGIPSIINGVHIIPEVLNGIVQNKGVAYINLYIDRKDVLYQRWGNRDQNKYVPYLDVSFEANLLLNRSTLELAQKNPSTFYSINITNLTIDKTLDKIIDFIRTIQS